MFSGHQWRYTLSPVYVSDKKEVSEAKQYARTGDELEVDVAAAAAATAAEEA